MNVATYLWLLSLFWAVMSLITGMIWGILLERKVWRSRTRNLMDLLMGITDPDHVHDWHIAKVQDLRNLELWVCLSCGKTSPGPTDNEALFPRGYKP